MCECVYVFQRLYSEPCQIKTTKQTVRVTQTGQVLSVTAEVGLGLLCLYVCVCVCVHKCKEKKRLQQASFCVCIFHLFATKQIHALLWRQNQMG